jgi:hypothetical protein
MVRTSGGQESNPFRSRHPSALVLSSFPPRAGYELDRLGGWKQVPLRKPYPTDVSDHGLNDAVVTHRSCPLLHETRLDGSPTAIGCVRRRLVRQVPGLIGEENVVSQTVRPLASSQR